MNATVQTEIRAAATLNDPRWASVLARDPAADGQFFYSVKTTGVYCRPSCGARHARPENVAFHLTLADAAQAGAIPLHPTRSASPKGSQANQCGLGGAPRALGGLGWRGPAALPRRTAAKSRSSRPSWRPAHQPDPAQGSLTMGSIPFHSGRPVPINTGDRNDRAPTHARDPNDVHNGDVRGAPSRVHSAGNTPARARRRPAADNNRVAAHRSAAGNELG